MTHYSSNDKLKCTTHIMESKFLSDEIGEDYKKWALAKTATSPTRVFLETPTGSGKTSFLINKLLPFAMETCRAIIYVCNRDALRKQFEKSLENSSLNLKKDPSYENHRFSIFHYPDNTGYIAVVNYQSIRRFPQSSLPGPWYLFLDEVHFFLEDASFNAHTFFIYNYIMSVYTQQIQIFASATIEDFLKLYSCTYRQFFPTNDAQPQLYAALYKYRGERYLSATAAPVFNVILYEKNQFLLDEIEKSKKEKWLIFVSSTENGEKLNSEIKKSKKTFLLTAKKKSTVTWKRLVEESYFSQDVLIATKVIDNGINICDDQLRNIVVPFGYKTEFIQMIGRKRFQQDSFVPINLYIEIPTIQKIRSRRRYYENKIRTLRDAYTVNSLNQKLAVIKALGNDSDDAAPVDVYCKKETLHLYVNFLAEEKYLLEKKFYEHLEKEHYTSPKIYKDLLEEWLGGRIAKFVNASLSTNLTDFLEKNVGCPFEDRELFYKEFLEMYQIYCGNLLQNGDITQTEYDRRVTLRKAKGRQKGTMNEALDYSQLPYVIKKDKNAYVIERTV